MSSDLSEASRMIEDCEKRESQLSDWERSYVDSLSRQVARGASLSPKQQDILDTLWDRVTTEKRR